MLQQQLLQFVTDLLPAWRKTRRKVLALGVQGLVRKRRMTLCALARGMDSQCRVIHRVKRLWRFVNNPAVAPSDAVGALTARAFSLRSTGWVPIILDETSLKGRATLLGAATAYRGRALPLALYAYDPQVVRKSIWAIREGLSSIIREALAPEAHSRLLLIADRGFAASHFPGRAGFRRLINSNVAFVIRVPRKVLLHMAYGAQCLETLAADLNRGDCIFLRGVEYGPARARLNVLLWWQEGQQEPWLLATTLNSERLTRQYYRLRMRVEEMFKDFKSSFCLEACQLQTLARIARVCLFLLLALWALALLVRYPNCWPRFITARGKLSFVSPPEAGKPRPGVARRTTCLTTRTPGRTQKWVTVRALCGAQDVLRAPEASPARSMFGAR